MKTAIFALQFPYGTDNEKQQEIARTLLDDSRKMIPTNSGIETLTETVWLIPLENGLPFLSWLVQSSIDSKLTWRVAFLDEAPTWILSA